MFSANAVNTAIDFKTITIAYSSSTLVVSLVILLYLFAVHFCFVKSCLKVLQCIEINCVFAPLSLKFCTMYIHMYISILCLNFSFCWQIFLIWLVFLIKTFDKITVLGSFDCCLFFFTSNIFKDTCAFNIKCGYLLVTK